MQEVIPQALDEVGQLIGVDGDDLEAVTSLVHEILEAVPAVGRGKLRRPDARLSDTAHQSYFLGLAFSSDGAHLYASMGSITDPTGAKSGNTGNGIAVYKFENGKVTSERFLKIAPQKIAAGKKGK